MSQRGEFACAAVDERAYVPNSETAPGPSHSWSRVVTTELSKIYITIYNFSGQNGGRSRKNTDQSR